MGVEPKVRTAVVLDESEADEPSCLAIRADAADFIRRSLKTMIEATIASPQRYATHSVTSMSFRILPPAPRMRYPNYDDLLVSAVDGFLTPLGYTVAKVDCGLWTEIKIQWEARKR